MADGPKAGIELEASGEAKFSENLEKGAKALDDFAGSAGEAAGKVRGFSSDLGELAEGASKADSAVGGLAGALKNAALDEQWKKNWSEVAQSTATLAEGLAVQATGVERIVNSLFDAMDDAAEYGDSIDKNSQKLGISRRAYQEWGYILDQSGSSINALKSSMQQLAKVQEGLTKTAPDDLAAISLSLEGIQDMSRKDLFSAVITGLQGMSESSERAMLAQRLLGSSYKDLMPLLNTSAEDTAALRDRFNELSLFMDDEAVDAAVAYGDSASDINAKWDAFKRNILTEFMPALTKLREEVINSGSLDSLAETIGKIASKSAELVGYFAENGDDFVGTLEAIGAAWATWKAAENAKTLVGNIRQLYQWVTLVGNALGITGGAAAAGVGVVGLGVAAVVDEVATLNTIGYLGNGHNLREYADNVEYWAQAIADWHDRNDEYINSGYTEGLEMLYTELQHYQIGLQHAQEEQARFQAKLEGTDLNGDTEAIKSSAAEAETVAAGLKESADSVASNAETLLSTFPETAGEIVSEFEAGAGEMSQKAAEAVEETNTAMSANMATLSGNAYIWGSDMMLSLAQGILDGTVSWVVPAIESVAGDIESMIGFSEPDVGPLANFHTFAPDMMALFAQGILDGRDLISGAIGQSFDLGPMIAAQNAGQSFNYGGVNVTIYGAEGQSVDELYEVFSYRLQREVVDRGAVFSS